MNALLTKFLCHVNTIIHDSFSPHCLKAHLGVPYNLNFSKNGQYVVIG